MLNLHASSDDSMEILGQAAARKRRRVSFRLEPASVGVADDLFSATAIHQVTEDDTTMETWYQREELVSFHKDRLLTVKALKRAKGDITRLDPSQCSLRGLEDIISAQYGRARRLKKTRTVRMILQVQAEQRELGVSDPELIRSLSMLFSQMSRDQAIEIAEIDAKACQEQPMPKRSLVLTAESSSKRRMVDRQQEVTQSVPIQPE